MACSTAYRLCVTPPQAFVAGQGSTRNCQSPPSYDKLDGSRELGINLLSPSLAHHTLPHCQERMSASQPILACTGADSLDAPRGGPERRLVVAAAHPGRRSLGPPAHGLAPARAAPHGARAPDLAPARHPLPMNLCSTGVLSVSQCARQRTPKAGELQRCCEALWFQLPYIIRNCNLTGSKSKLYYPTPCAGAQRAAAVRGHRAHLAQQRLLREVQPALLHGRAAPCAHPRLPPCHLSVKLRQLLLCILVSAVVAIRSGANDGAEGGAGLMCLTPNAAPLIWRQPQKRRDAT